MNDYQKVRIIMWIFALRSSLVGHAIEATINLSAKNIVNWLQCAPRLHHAIRMATANQRRAGTMPICAFGCALLSYDVRVCRCRPRQACVLFNYTLVVVVAGNWQLSSYHRDVSRHSVTGYKKSFVFVVVVVCPHTLLVLVAVLC